MWISLSATVILYNKYILTWGMFPYPVALTMWHMGFCSVLAFGIVRAGYVDAVGMSPETYLKCVPSPEPCLVGPLLRLPPCHRAGCLRSYSGHRPLAE